MIYKFMVRGYNPPADDVQWGIVGADGAVGYSRADHRQRLGLDIDRPLMHLQTITPILAMERTVVEVIVGFEQHPTTILS